MFFLAGEPLFQNIAVATILAAPCLASKWLELRIGPLASLNMACRETNHHAEAILAQSLAAAMVQWPGHHLLAEEQREILQSRLAWLGILRTNAIFLGDVAERRGLARVMVEYKTPPRLKELRLTVPVAVAMALHHVTSGPAEEPQRDMHWESLLTHRRPWPLTMPEEVQAQMQRQKSTSPITVDFRLPSHLKPAEPHGPSWRMLVQSDSEVLRNWHDTLEDSFRIGATQDLRAVQTWQAAAARAK